MHPTQLLQNAEQYLPSRMGRGKFTYGGTTHDILATDAEDTRVALTDFFMLTM